MRTFWSSQNVISAWTISLLLLVLASGLYNAVSALDCYCEGDGCAPHHVNNTCTAPLKSKCFASIREEINENGHKEPVHVYGCLPADESTIMQCKGNLVPHRMRTTILCCDGQDFCNQHLEPELKELTTLPPVVPESKEKLWIATGILGVLAFLVICGVLVIYFWDRCRKRKLATMDPQSRIESQALMSRLFSSNPSANDAPEMSMTSGSGSGCPRLVQISIVKQLQFLRCVGKGRYGEVWQARFRDEDVAVKIFSTLDQASWEAERELYQTCMLAHENVLGFKAADIGGTGSCTQMLLVTDYHRASLYDYLKEQPEPLSFSTMIRMAHSIACGLSHLHASIYGTHAKPSIVHRDLKSKNILVRVNSPDCVIADFGLALREDQHLPDSDEWKKRQGTRRYMAPEVLDFTIQHKAFESFRQADTYSFGLVLWEFMRCTEINGMHEGYELPYYDCVGNDPSFDDMRNVVCDLKIRPQIPEYWLEQEYSKGFVALMQECWNPSPSARVTALRAKKTLAKLGLATPSS